MVRVRMPVIRSIDNDSSSHARHERGDPRRGDGEQHAEDHGDTADGVMSAGRCPAAGREGGSTGPWSRSPLTRPVNRRAPPGSTSAAARDSAIRRRESSTSRRPYQISASSPMDHPPKRAWLYSALLGQRKKDVRRSHARPNKPGATVVRRRGSPRLSCRGVDSENVHIQLPSRVPADLRRRRVVRRLPCTLRDRGLVSVVDVVGAGRCTQSFWPRSTDSGPSPSGGSTCRAVCAPSR